MDKGLRKEITEKLKQGITAEQIHADLTESAIEVTLKEIQGVTVKTEQTDQKAVKKGHPEIVKLNAEALELLEKLTEKVNEIIKVKTRPEVRQSFSPQTNFLRAVHGLKKTFI